MQEFQIHFYGVTSKFDISRGKAVDGKSIEARKLTLL